VVVFENEQAFPRAWIVHSVRPNHDGAGLALLASGQLDGRATAVVDGELSHIRQAGIVRGQAARPTSGSTATVVERSPESMTIEAEALRDGLLVISEMYEEGWVAYVDGEPVEIVRTNHAFRGVPVTSGKHTVELRYESQPLTIGLWISGTALVGMVASIGWLAWTEGPRWRRRWWQAQRARSVLPESMGVKGYTETGP
jgi:hypothetical protein